MDQDLDTFSAVILTASTQEKILTRIPHPTQQRTERRRKPPRPNQCMDKGWPSHVDWLIYDAIYKWKNAIVWRVYLGVFWVLSGLWSVIALGKAVRLEFKWICPVAASSTNSCISPTCIAMFGAFARCLFGECTYPLGIIRVIDERWIIARLR